MNKKSIRVGVIGVGCRATSGFAPTFNARDEVNVVALCDLNEVRMKESAAKFEGTQNFYTKPADMFEKEKLDAVLITSPDYLHGEHAIAALNSGVNVLIDKPLAISVKECKKIIETAEKNKKIVMIGFNLRHNPVLKRLKEIVNEGTLGNIFLIENREFYDGGRTYMSRWNRQRKWSGGLWIHKGSHDFDIFQWLMNFPKPIRVSASAGINVFKAQNIPFEIKKGILPGPTCNECNYKLICKDACPFDHNEFPQWGADAVKNDGYIKDLCMYLSDKDVHDNGLSIVEYDNGARASHMECFACSLTDRMYTLIGDRAVAEVSLHKRYIRILPRWTQEIITYEIPLNEGGHSGADPNFISDFIDVMNGNNSNTSTAEHGMWSTAVGEAAEIASRENRTVLISELMK